MATLRERLMGTWEMEDFKIVEGDMLVDPPLGATETLGGYLIYSADGHMVAFLSQKDIPRFADESLDGGTSEERARAHQGIITYVGTFDVDEVKSTVTHHVKYASVPNMMGRDLTRICVWQGERLKLDTPPMVFGGKMKSSYILWRRAKSHA
ncbi:lipocalin-like domain-containing protein [Pseudomonas putida]|uniref:lipocalin-like domain-containing protein n=1 Tax=Pseudomonas putida TaxID=303 RepID=UPI00300F21DE